MMGELSVLRCIVCVCSCCSCRCSFYVYNVFHHRASHFCLAQPSHVTKDQFLHHYYLKIIYCVLASDSEATSSNSEMRADWSAFWCSISSAPLTSCKNPAEAVTGDVLIELSTSLD